MQMRGVARLATIAKCGWLFVHLSSFQAVVSCLERNFETSKQSKTPFYVLLLSSLTGTSHYFYLDSIWAAPRGSEFNPVPCHFVFLA